MKRTYRFVEVRGTVACTMDGHSQEIPVVPGILKHPTLDQLRKLLEDPLVVRRYVREALARAPWSVLSHFPRALLKRALAQERLRPERRRALEFLLEERPPE